MHSQIQSFVGNVKMHGGQCNDDDLLLLSIHRPRIHSIECVAVTTNEMDIKWHFIASKILGFDSIYNMLHCVPCVPVCRTRNGCHFFFVFIIIFSFLFHLLFLRSQTLISFICFACHLFVPLMQTWRFLFFIWCFYTFIRLQCELNESMIGNTAECKWNWSMWIVNSWKLSAFSGEEKGKQTLAFYFSVHHVC